MPGYRSDLMDLIPGKGGNPSVPNNVVNYFNRWQNNGPFPLDFLTDAHLPLDNGAAARNPAK